MAIEEPQFRIIPDPEVKGHWAYETLFHWKRGEIVGGFRSPQEARKAFNRAKAAQ